MSFIVFATKFLRSVPRRNVLIVVIIFVVKGSTVQNMA